MRDVRRGRVEAAQQNAKAFHQRHLTASGVARLNVERRRAASSREGPLRGQRGHASVERGGKALQRVDHLHRAGDHGVVLHALVVVVHLLEHRVDLAPQCLGLLAKFNIF